MVKVKDVIEYPDPKLEIHVCEVCGAKFAAKANMKSHLFWKHEYLAYKAKRMEAQARGEMLTVERGMGGESDKWFGPPPGIAEIVRHGRQLRILE